MQPWIKYDIILFMIQNKSERYKHMQVMVCPTMHKDLRIQALKQDITLGELLQRIIKLYLKEKKGGE